VITSDHGEEFFEHALPGHRKSLFDEVLRVPLLIVPPKSMRQGLVSQVDAQASLSDLMPTLLDFVGVEVPETVVGQSLRPAMYGQPFSAEPALLSLYIAKQWATGDKDHMQTYGLRTPEYKFFRATLIEAGKPTQLLPYYFDLTIDPEERHVVREIADPRVQRAWTELEERLDDVRQHWQTHPRSSRADRTTNLPEDFTTQELKMLGYLDIDDTSSLSLDLKPWGLGPMARVDLPGGKGGNGLMLGGVLLIAAALATALVLRVRGRGRERGRERGAG
jgi:arylsulfatase A-like enzyme